MQMRAGKLGFTNRFYRPFTQQYIVLNSNFYLNSDQENIIHGTIFAHGNPFGRSSAISTVISLLRVVTSIVVITIT